MQELIFRGPRTCKSHYRPWLAGGNYLHSKILRLSQVHSLDILITDVGD